ncbi:MAG: hypothetical protein V2A73_01220 [Pseudomonadota bacterium]
MAIALGQSDRTLIYATQEYRAGFVDTESMTLVKEIDLRSLFSESPWVIPTHASVIGDYGYLFFTQWNSKSPGPAIVKLSLVDQETVAFWQLPPDSLSYANTTDRHLFHGVVASDRPNKGILTGDPVVNPDVSVIEIDLETGENSRRFLFSGTGRVQNAMVFDVIGSRLVLGLLSDDEHRYHGFLFDLNENRLKWLAEWRSGISLAVDVGNDRVYEADMPSTGIIVFSLTDGSSLPAIPYVWGGYGSRVAVAPGCRLVLTQNGATNSWLSLMDGRTGGLLTWLTFPSGQSLFDIAITKNGTAFVGGRNHITSVALP